MKIYDLNTLVDKIYKIITSKYCHENHIASYTITVNDVPVKQINKKIINSDTLEIKFKIQETDKYWDPDEPQRPLFITYTFNKNQQIEYICSNDKSKYLLNFNKHISYPYLYEVKE